MTFLAHSRNLGQIMVSICLDKQRMKSMGTRGRECTLARNVRSYLSLCKHHGVLIVEKGKEMVALHNHRPEAEDAGAKLY